MNFYYNSILTHFAILILCYSLDNNRDNCNVFANEQSSTLAALIQENPDLTRFAQALTSADRLSILDGSDDDVYSVFAPLNSAIETDRAFQVYMNDPITWSRHLQTNVDLHIIPGQVLTNTDIFDGLMTQLTSLNGEQVNITQQFNLVQGQEVVDSGGTAGTNGVYHLVEGVLPNYFRLFNFYNSIHEHPELHPELSNVIDIVGFEGPLVEFQEEVGSTWLAPSSRAFSSSDRTMSAEEITDPNNVNETYNTLLYNLIDVNVYEENFPEESYLLVLPRYSGAHMIITKDVGGNNFRFNDARVTRSYLANNGQVYIVDRILMPPGLIEQLGFIAEYTNVNVRQTHELLISTSWDTKNMWNSVGGSARRNTRGSKQYTAVINPNEEESYRNFTMFVPMSAAYDVPRQNLNHWMQNFSPVWIRHLQTWMGHFLIQPAMTYDELYQYCQSNNGNVQLQMVSGYNTTLFINDSDELQIDNARFIEPDFRDLRGVDGYAHFISDVPMPPYFEFNIYEVIQQHPQLSVLETFIDTIFFGVFITNLSPVTYFAMPDHFLDVQIGVTEMENVIRNHIFRGLLYTDVLKEDYNNSHITSLNGLNWTVQVVDDKIYIDRSNSYTNATIIEIDGYSDIVCRTGVLHFVDHLFLKREYPVYPAVQGEDETSSNIFGHNETEMNVTSSDILNTSGTITSETNSSVTTTTPLTNVTTATIIPEDTHVVDIEISFNIDIWIGADPNATELVLEALQQFVLQVVANFTGDTSPEEDATQQGRRLQVVLEPDSVEILALLPCLPDYDCTTVFTKYEILVTEDDDPARVGETLTEASQTGAMDGTLEGIVHQIDPATPITISEPTQTLPPAPQSPNANNATLANQTNDDGANVVQVNETENISATTLPQGNETGDLHGTKGNTTPTVVPMPEPSQSPANEPVIDSPSSAPGSSTPDTNETGVVESSTADDDSRNNILSWVWVALGILGGYAVWGMLGICILYCHHRRKERTSDANGSNTSENDGSDRDPFPDEEGPQPVVISEKARRGWKSMMRDDSDRHFQL